MANSPSRALEPVSCTASRRNHASLVKSANYKRAESVFSQWEHAMCLKVVNGGTFEIKQAVVGTTCFSLSLVFIT